MSYPDLAATLCFRRFHNFVCTCDEILNESIGNSRSCVNQSDTQVNATEQQWSPQK